MTQNKVMFNITEQIPHGAFVINVERPHGEDLGTIAVFISALLLSTGAFLSQVIQACTRSRCKEILCPCSKCVREVPSAFEQQQAFHRLQQAQHFFCFFPCMWTSSWHPFQHSICFQQVTLLYHHTLIPGLFRPYTHTFRSYYHYPSTTHRHTYYDTDDMHFVFYYRFAVLPSRNEKNLAWVTYLVETSRAQTRQKRNRSDTW